MKILEEISGRSMPQPRRFSDSRAQVLAKAAALPPRESHEVVRRRVVTNTQRQAGADPLALRQQFRTMSKRPGSSGGARPASHFRRAAEGTCAVAEITRTFGIFAVNAVMSSLPPRRLGERVDARRQPLSSRMLDCCGRTV